MEQTTERGTSRMLYLVRFVQHLETFRRNELEALASLYNINLECIDYSEYTPYCIISLPDNASAKFLISRSILIKNIYELWASATDYPTLHRLIQETVPSTSPRDPKTYSKCSFKISIDTFQNSRSLSAQRKIVETFSYLPFYGEIKMTEPDETFTVFEESVLRGKAPLKLHFGRLLGNGARDLLNIYTLKKRKYISTTSMDAELALLTANLSLARPGTLFYDPFIGTGSLPIACSHFGAITFGSDIDGRSLRGKLGRNVDTSFEQYELKGRYLESFVGDLTHSPLREREGGWLDGIVCDPPYGVREGLKVLGSRDGGGKEVIYVDGVAAHLREGYYPPKRPYSFEAMLDDILSFAATNLVANGRLALWMPTANDEEQELGIPSHPALELVSSSVQVFNKWSRRLIIYRNRTREEMNDLPSSSLPARVATNGNRADDLNNFRKRYFEGFKSESGKSIADAS